MTAIKINKMFQPIGRMLAPSHKELRLASGNIVIPDDRGEVVVWDQRDRHELADAGWHIGGVYAKGTLED
ncbi:hypothetical protein [Bradyrhizobium jicamae]|uniref:hypothetical protein n=1 Tax=Bradyrhizobium jicamae TaxID=280332 RepID=UPI001BA95AA5|nr:hypothetical protein [Bradyrhizobium jicamae]MBR0934857.1 hypothetical protein [Bradyrhizobium jicamae]